MCIRDSINGVIVISPNGVHLNWVTEILKHSPIPAHAVAWSTPKRADFEQRAKLNKLHRYPGLKWLTINMEALKHLDCRQEVKRFIASCHGKFMLIVSEAHHFGRPGSKRTYFARSLGLHAAFRQNESGTPVLNSPLRAFSQFEILQPKALGYETFTDFADQFAEYEQRPGKRYKHCLLYTSRCV